MQGISRPYPAPQLILLSVTLAKGLLTSLFKNSEIIGDKLKGIWPTIWSYFSTVAAFLSTELVGSGIHFQQESKHPINN